MVLSIDCGTQSTRALLFSLDGKLIDKAQIFYQPYNSPQAGRAEQNAEVYWTSVCEAIQNLKEKDPERFSKIIGVGVTTLRSTMVNVDSDGNPLMPSPVWLDQRKADNVYRPNLFFKLIFRLLGLTEVLKKMERKGHCNWIRQNKPEIWKKTHKYLQVSGYLNFKLTGRFVDSVASQIGYIPFDSKKLKWANPKDAFEFSSKLYPIEKEKLPELVNPGEKIGGLSAQAAELTGLPEGTLVIACGSDKGCETLGIGALHTDIAGLSFGTTATVQTTVAKYMEPIRFFPSYPSLMNGHWNPEIEIFRGFWMISWFKEEFAYKEVQKAAEMDIPAEMVLNELLHKAPAGSMGLIVQPYWTPGLGEKNAKGVMLGFGDVHKKEHIYRAVIEGLAYGLLDGMKRLEKRGGFQFKTIAVSGGAAQSDEICQITADIFNMPLLRGQTHETSGLGAAIVTAFGAGAYATLNDAVDKMVHYEKTFQPNPENTAIYSALFNEVYLKLYRKLEPLNKKIREITGYPEN